MNKAWIYTLMFLMFLTFFGTVFFLFQDDFEPSKILPAKTAVPENSKSSSLKSDAAENPLNPLASSQPKITNPISDEAASETKAPDTSKTSPVPEESGFSFALIGDTQRFEVGNANGDFQKAAASLKNQNVNLIIAVGDLLSGCEGGKKCEDKYSSWKDIVNPIVSSIYEVQGNHDRSSDEKSDQAWQDSFNLPENGPEGYKEMVYYFDYENSHFVILDSEKPKEHIVDQTQRDWLKKDLEENKKDNIFVFFHEPAFPVSSKIGESLDAKAEERDALWEILKEHKVTTVFNGHEHIASRKKIDGIYQFVFGNTDSFNHDLPKDGVAEYSYQGEHYGIVKVNGKKVTVETYSVDGKLQNTFQLPD
jgi:3',5'-cyclic-AMP phosphodiesterase